MKIKIVFTIIGVAMLQLNTMAQEKWSLNTCIAYALEHNLQMENAFYNTKDAELDYKRFRDSRLPSVSADIGGGYQFGRNIDPTTNTFDGSTISYSSYGITGSVPVYNGGRIKNRIEQSKINLNLTDAEQKSVKRDLRLAVTQAFLNVLLAEENLENMDLALQQSRTQLKQIEKQIELGALAENEQLDFAAQVFKDYKNVVEAENQVNINYLTLKQQLGMDSETELTAEKPEEPKMMEDESAYEWTTLYTQAESNEPQLSADRFRLQSAEKEVAISKASFYPSISVFGTLSSNTSSEAKTVESMESILIPEGGLLNGEPVQFAFSQDIPNLSDVKYFTQLEDNLAQGVGINITVPIFQANQSRIIVEKAKVNVLRSRSNLKQSQQNLKMEVLKARNNWASSKEAFAVAGKSLDAFELANNDANRRFELGRGSAFEVTSAKNNLDRAKFEFTQAKYQYIFNQQILNFYLGKDIEL